MRSRIEPMKNIARSLRRRRELILNYFRAQKLLSSDRFSLLGSTRMNADKQSLLSVLIRVHPWPPIYSVR